MKATKTNRGFAIIEFPDHYGEKCSLQKSSLAFTEAIWLGTEGRVSRMTPSGWQDFTPKEFEEEFGVGREVLVHSRMHLTQEMVRELLPALQHFAETGELPLEEGS